MADIYVQYPQSSGGGGSTGSSVGVPYIIAPLDSAAASPNGGVIGSNAFYFQSASQVNPGLVSSAGQTFSGTKKFIEFTLIGNPTLAPDALLTLSSNTATVAPPANTMIHIIGASNDQSRIVVDAYNSAVSGGAGGLYGRRSRGTGASPTAVTSEDTLVFVGGSGYGTTGFSSGTTGTLSFKASQLWTDSNQGTYFRISLTADSTTASVERLVLASSGILRLGAYAGATGIFVVGSGGSLVSGSVSLATQTSGSISLVNQVVGILPQANMTGVTGSNTGDVSFAAVGAAPSANGATVGVGQVVTLQPADATHPGLVTTAAQNFAGNKFFSANIQAVSQVIGQTHIIGSISIICSTSALGYALTLPGNQGSSSFSMLTNDGTGRSYWALKSDLLGSGVTSVVTPSLTLGSITMTQAAGGTAYSLAFPISQGSASWVIQNNGTGTLSWTPLITANQAASVSANYNVNLNDTVIFASSSNYTITLFSPVGNNKTVKIIRTTNVGSTSLKVTIVSSQTATIGPASTILLATQGDCLEVTSDSANWQVTNFAVSVAATMRNTIGSTTNVILPNFSETLSGNTLGSFTAVYDTQNGYNVGSSAYTVKYPGTYHVFAEGQFSGAVLALGNAGGFKFMGNGNGLYELQDFAGGNSAFAVSAHFVGNFVAGDTINLQARNQATTPTLINPIWTIERIGG